MLNPRFTPTVIVNNRILADVLIEDDESVTWYAKNNYPVDLGKEARMICGNGEDQLQTTTMFLMGWNSIVYLLQHY